MIVAVCKNEPNFGREVAGMRGAVVHGFMRSAHDV